MGGRSAAIVGTLGAGVFAVVGACSSFSDANDGPNGAPDGAPGDADALPTPADGARDSGTGCSPLEGGFCATLAPPPTFCADFDNPECALRGFSSVTSNPAVTMEFSDIRQQSKPYSVHFTQMQSVPQTGSWGLVTSFIVPTRAVATTIEINLQYRVPTLPADGGAERQRIGPIHLDATPSGGPTVDFFVEADKCFFVVGAATSTPTYSANGPATATSQWRSLSLLFTLQPNGTSTFTGTFQQATAPLFLNEPLTPPLVAGQTLTMTIGYDAKVLTQGEMYVDNVVVNIKP